MWLYQYCTERSGEITLKSWAISNKALERGLPDKYLGRLLVTSDLPECHSSWPEARRLFDAPCRNQREFLAGLCGQLCYWMSVTELSGTDEANLFARGLAAGVLYRGSDERVYEAVKKLSTLRAVCLVRAMGWCVFVGCCGVDMYYKVLCNSKLCFEQILEAIIKQVLNSIDPNEHRTFL